MLEQLGKAVGRQFGDDLKDKVKKGLVKKYSEEKKKDDAQAKQNKLDEIAKKAEWKSKKSSYKSARKKTIDALAKIHKKSWEDENSKRSEIKENGGTNQDIEKAIQDIRSKKDGEIEDKFNEMLQNKLVQYIQDAQALKGMKIVYDDEKKHVLNQAEKKFAKEKTLEIGKLNLAYQASLEQFDLQKIIDEQMRELSNIPIKVEQKLGEVRDLMDQLLGNIIVDPTSPEFDADILVNQIEAMVKPAFDSTKPLKKLGGKIPILPDLAGILKLLEGQDKPSTPITKEDIMKMCPVPPSLPPSFMDKLQGIVTDIQQMCQMFPMIYINIIFAILDRIWKMLEIITGIIPLGNMYPLNIIPSAVKSLPKVIPLIWNLPTQMMKLVKGIAMKKLQEAAALGFPKPNIDLEGLKSMIPDITQNPPTPEVFSEVKKDFSKVSQDFYEKTAKGKGFTEYQIKQIQKNYKAIYDNSKTKIKTFKDDGEQDLASTEGSVIDMLKSAAGVVSSGAASVGIGSGGGSGGSKKEDKLGYKSGDEITRDDTTPEKYEAFLESEIKPTLESTSAIVYPHIYTTQDLMGEYYKMFENQLTSLGNEVVLYDTMRPAVPNIASLRK